MAQRDPHLLNDSGPGSVLSVMKESMLRGEGFVREVPPRAVPAAEAPPVTFEGFFQEHHGRLFSTLCLVAESRAEAEDLMQDAFVKIFERWERVSTHENPPGYLYKTAFNLLRNRRRGALSAARRVFVPSEGADPYAQIDDRGVLVDALRELSVRQRAAVVLTDLLDYPSPEAAKMLGVRPVTVRVLASQGRAHLKARLALEGEDHVEVVTE